MVKALREASANDIAAWSVTLLRHSVPASTVRLLGVTARLAGVEEILRLGPDAVDGSAEGRAAVRHVLACVADRRDASTSLARIESLMRRMFQMQGVGR